MMKGAQTGRLWTKLGDSRGQSLIEFSISTILLVMLLFGVIEMSRMVLVYNTVANAARAGARYAITHGSVPGTSASAATTAMSSMKTNACNTVINFLSAAPVNTSRVDCTNTTQIVVSYPDCSSCNFPGNHVSVTVTYPYDPIATYFPFPSISVASTSQGVITW